ncbi:hypothetical protein [Micromonospora sp. HUAS LYJ1]|uniref:hypothetical protein n=1 Tax=Micromonospora sp. HUAS LYJ1 TaxID=3061626 RepID=UPI002671F5FF|nr:hypothetical protein [Micromonospora sp. HUAS LYJ1]WKU05752.1 hypothetical protein Q2K16_01395 [Micromonospora sp. HUAS LYJ1]
MLTPPPPRRPAPGLTSADARRTRRRDCAARGMGVGQFWSFGRPTRRRQLTATFIRIWGIRA